MYPSTREAYESAISEADGTTEVLKIVASILLDLLDSVDSLEGGTD